MGGGKTAGGQIAARGAIAPASREEQKATAVCYGCLDREDDTVVFDLKTHVLSRRHGAKWVG